jgi:hypothetical protein
MSDLPRSLFLLVWIHWSPILLVSIFQFKQGMKQEPASSECELSIVQILRPLGTQPMSMERAHRAAQLLEVHWTSVSPLRKRYLEDHVLLRSRQGRRCRVRVQTA